MSTIEDFENAPVAATATRDGALLAIKIGDGERCWLTPVGTYLGDEEMMVLGYTLEPTVPATAREALDLAWELAHEVKEGQVIPEGTQYVRRWQRGGLSTHTAREGWAPSPQYAEGLRTLDPLPVPLPDWLDAPAVLARHDEWDRDKLDVFTPAHEGAGRWTRAGISWAYHWSELRDVTPLYPKETEK